MYDIYQRLHDIPSNNSTLSGVFQRTGIGDIPPLYQHYAFLSLSDALREVRAFERSKKGLRMGYDRGDVYTLLALSINRYVTESGIHKKYAEYASLPDTLDVMLALSDDVTTHKQPYMPGVDGETEHEYSTAHLAFLIKVELSSNPNLNDQTLYTLLHSCENPENNIGWNSSLNKRHLHNFFDNQVNQGILRPGFIRYILRDIVGKFNSVDGELITAWLAALLCKKEKVALSDFWYFFDGMSKNKFTTQESFEEIIPLIHQNIGFAVARQQVCLDLFAHPNFPKKHIGNIKEKLFQETKDVSFLQPDAHGLFVF